MTRQTGGQQPGTAQAASPATRPAAAHPATRISYLVQALAGLFHRRIEQVLRPLELTEAQLTVLDQLAIGPGAGLPAGELAAGAGCTDQSMAGDLAALAGRGLIGYEARQGEMPWVRIEDTGREIVARAEHLAAPVEAEALRLLSSGESEVLRALLLRTMSALTERP